MRVVFFYAGARVVHECRTWETAWELVELVRSAPMRSLEGLVGGWSWLTGESFGEGL